MRLGTFFLNGTFKNPRTTGQPTCSADAVRGITFYKPRSGLHFARNLKMIFKISTYFSCTEELGIKRNYHQNNYE
ncbi:MAG: hypothetical protein AAFY76_13570 [Cyanobacteria bacterium J06649_11]